MMELRVTLQTLSDEDVVSILRDVQRLLNEDRRTSHRRPVVDAVRVS